MEIEHVYLEPNECSFDIEKIKNKYYILIEYKYKKISDESTQYDILSEDFNNNFNRFIDRVNKYTINEWITNNFDSMMNIHKFLKKIGMSEM